MPYSDESDTSLVTVINAENPRELQARKELENEVDFVEAPENVDNNQRDAISIEGDMSSGPRLPRKPIELIQFGS